MRANQLESDSTKHALFEAVDRQTIPLRVIAVLLVIAAAYAGSQLLIPFMLALMVSIAVSPVATWLEKRGLPRFVGALLCTLTLALLISASIGLLIYEAGTILKDTDRYLQRFGQIIDVAQRRFQPRKPAHDVKASRNVSDSDARQSQTVPAQTAPNQSSSKQMSDATTGSPGERLLHRNLGHLQSWALQGLGGALGVLGETILFLAFLFYMLQGREGWIEGFTAAARRLGLKPVPGQVEKVQDQIVRYLGCLATVAFAYMVIVSLGLWLMKVPQPLLWGLLAGLLEVVPYFGPLVASIFPTIISLSLGSWWQPIGVASMFLTLHLVEGNLIAPLFYGKAVKLDPVTILFSAIFFGGLWGPVGLAIATPMMITLRGLLIITPDTPALDALADVKVEKAAVQSKVMPPPSE
ncbi:MAG: hypothetical protein NVSMB9_13370 [Isosphaeraceae bacterium]